MNKFMKVKTFDYNWKVTEFKESCSTRRKWIEIDENSLIQWIFVFKDESKFYSFHGSAVKSACVASDFYIKISSQIITSSGRVLADYEDEKCDFLCGAFIGGCSEIISKKTFNENIKITETGGREEFVIKCKVEFFRRPFVLKLPKTGSSILWRIYSDNLFPDCIMKSAEGVDFQVHKAVLAANSSVFSSMFGNEMQEKTKAIIELPESQQVLKELFHYFYTREVEELSEIAENLLTAANKYLVEDLKLICAAEILDNLNVDNAIRLLVFANHNNCQEIEDAAAQFIASNCNAVRATEDWKSFNKDEAHAALRNKINDCLLMDIDKLKSFIKSVK